MEKIKHLVFQHQDKLKYGLLIAAGVASINCLARPDYNIIIYIYIYYIWNILESKVNIITYVRKFKQMRK